MRAHGRVEGRGREQGGVPSPIEAQHLQHGAQHLRRILQLLWLNSCGRELISNFPDAGAHASAPLALVDALEGALGRARALASRRGRHVLFLRVLHGILENDERLSWRE